MFKKIHSENGSSAIAEACQAMQPIFLKLKSKCKKLVFNHPKKLYVFMLLLLIYSLLFNFWPRTISVKAAGISELGSKTTPVENVLDGLDRIGKTGGKIRENIALTRKVDSLMSLDALSPQDSLFLMRALKHTKPKQP